MAGDDAESSRAQAVAEQSIVSGGLASRSLRLLRPVAQGAPLSISEIQDKVLLASGSMMAAIDRLEKRGLVIRKSTSKYRRARIVELTREGKQVAATFFEKHARDLEVLMSVLSAKQKKQMYESLKKLGLHATQQLGDARQVLESKHVRAESTQ